MADPEERRQAAPDLTEHDTARDRAPDPDDRAGPRREGAGGERRRRSRRVEPERRALTRGEERRSRPRRADTGGARTRSGAAPATLAAATTSVDGAPAVDRRRERTLAEQREYWSQVRRRLRAADLEPFAGLLDKLAKAAFGAEATVVPHLRNYGSRPFLLFVVDAASPEACTHYESFLPLERAFWTAYATIPKPDAPFAVAVRPARGWCRAEALMPVFASMPASEYVS